MQQFLSRADDGLVVSGDNGSVTVYRCDKRQERLVTSHQLPAIHESSCTSVCVSQDGSIVSAGEDNKIFHLSVESSTPVRTIGQHLFHVLYRVCLHNGWRSSEENNLLL